MAGKKDKSFVRNVAKERTYRNQNEEYEDAYFKWRADESNQYSFNYVHDSREHSYMAGRGFIKHGADTAESQTLHNCLRLLGAVMLVMLMFDVVNYLLAMYMNGGPCGVLYFSKRYTIGTSETFACMIYTCVSILKYITAIIIYQMRMKLPRQVALPSGKSNNTAEFRATAIMIMLMIIVMGRLASTLLSVILSVVNVDSVYIYMFDSREPLVQIISAVYNCIIMPVLCELLFRGLVLQSFRQFGDSFAVAVASIACGLCFYDLTYIGFSILCSMVIGVFTVRSGSIVTAILMHAVTTTVNYMVVYVGTLNPTLGRILAIALCILICIGALVAYTRLNYRNDWTFNADTNESELTFTKKVKIMLSSNTVAMWFVCALILTIVNMRIGQ
ncbi:MAG: CPBP family intramembrane metalloprotease [Ruminococcus albus]|jgi:hypothetical protein|nr:CPBP family intramembrane metalloprotease [Ruminococcus albus]